MPRGAERELADISHTLAERGHRVTVVTGSRSGWHRSAAGRMREYAVPLPLPDQASRRGWTEETAFAVTAGLAATLSRIDVVHCLHYADAWGVLQTSRVHRRPVVLKITGIVEPERISRVRVDRRMFREAIAHADEVWCNSTHAQQAMASFGRPMLVMPAPVDLSVFRRSGPRDAAPLVVTTASPMEPRKRLVDLLDAWPRVREVVSDARLVVAGAISSQVRSELAARVHPSYLTSVEFPGALGEDALVDLLSRAHVAVAPAVGEALGLATLEALACGTAVAGADSGATPILLRDGLGETFTPLDPVDLARAVVQLLSQPTDIAIERARRESVSAYDLPVIAAAIEARYAALRSSR